jgi:hypothetical protein
MRWNRRRTIIYCLTRKGPDLHLAASFVQVTYANHAFPPCINFVPDRQVGVVVGHFARSGFAVIHLGRNSNGSPPYPFHSCSPFVFGLAPAFSRMGWSSPFFHMMHASAAPPMNSPPTKTCGNVLACPQQGMRAQQHGHGHAWTTTTTVVVVLLVVVVVVVVVVCCACMLCACACSDMHVHACGRKVRAPRCLPR